MKWFGVFHVVLFFVSALICAENKENMSFNLPPFHVYLFKEQVDFLLSRMEKVVQQDLGSPEQCVSFTKTGEFLVAHYESLSPAQRARFLNCITI